MSDEKRLRASLLKLVARREYSQGELKEKLLEKGFDLEAILAILSDFKERGWQSDDRFAENLVRYRKNQGRGPVRILYELRQKQVDSELIDRYLVIEDPVWYEAAKKAACKKGLPKDAKAKAKIIRYLQYAGFSMQQIQYALTSSQND